MNELRLYMLTRPFDGVDDDDYHMLTIVAPSETAAINMAVELCGPESEAGWKKGHCADRGPAHPGQSVSIVSKTMR